MKESATTAVRPCMTTKTAETSPKTRTKTEMNRLKIRPLPVPEAEKRYVCASLVGRFTILFLRSRASTLPLLGLGVNALSGGTRISCLLGGSGSKAKKSTCRVSV